jgi:hypothetical protein
VIVTVTGSPSGSTTPTIETVANLWLGGQSSPSLGPPPLQSGG